MKAPCHASKNRAFINPTPNDSPDNRRAISMCNACPIIRECAELALTSGNTLKPGFAGPAQDVIQAGVVCRGDLSTAFALAAVAGQPVPDYQSMETERRAEAPDECVHCEQPMVPWRRDKSTIPEGYREHHARGYCSECRVAYKEALEAEPPSGRGLCKEIDRKRHHARPQAKPEKAPGQLELFA